MSDQALATNPKETQKTKPAPAAPAAATPEQTVTAALKDMPRQEVRPLPEPRIFCAHASMGKCGNVWIATTEAGTPFEHTLFDSFWANKAKDMHVGDEIRILHDDMRYEGLLLVTGVRTVGAGTTANRVSVFPIRRTEVTPAENYVDIGDLEVVFQGPHRQWCLKRRKDGAIVNEGYADRDAAERARRSVMAAKTK